MAFYAYKYLNHRQTRIKYRLTPKLKSGWMTGNAYHEVTISYKYEYLTEGEYIELDRAYYYDETRNIHCCENGREAAEYVARHVLGASMAR